MMKKINAKSIIIIFFAVSTAIILQGCFDKKVPFDGTSWKVRSVKSGNEIVLDNELTVHLLGIKNTPTSKDYLEQNVKGKRIKLKADSKHPDYFIKPSQETIYAHVVFDENGSKRIDLNSFMLLSGFAKFSKIPNNDSLNVYLKMSMWEPPVVLTSEQLSLLMTPATFFISDVSEMEKGYLSFGTGFFISSDGLALTNNHVMEYVNNPEFYTAYLSDAHGNISESNKRYISRIIYTDPVNDFTIFRVQLDPNEVSPCLFVSRREADPERGSRVGVVGNPKGLTATFSEGVVSAIRRSDNVIQITAPIATGNSGGPVCNECGNVIGIVRSTVADSDGKASTGNLNFAVDIRCVREALDQIKDIKHYHGK